MKFAVGITLFNPDHLCLENIKKYLNSFDKVIIYDNSLNNEEYAHFIELIGGKCIYIYNSSNDGLCVAINKMLDICFDQNIDYLCTMDQDSIFNSDDIEIIKSYIINNKNEENAVIAPYIRYSHVKDIVTPKNEIDVVPWVITSGSFLNVNLLVNRNIRYDENYFIDRCDLDFSKHIIDAGLKICRINSSFLYQSLGELNSKNYSEHSYIRHYYMFRNRFYYGKKYGQSGICILQTIKHVYLIIRYESDKKNKLHQLWIALNDYLSGKMGKRE